MDRRQVLLKKLTILDFMATDIGLYLNTHPDDYASVQKYNAIVEEAKAARREYEAAAGPLTSWRCPVNKEIFEGDCYFPWEKEFNCGLTEKPPKEGF
ncbi:MAG: spore coat protein CotJB [Clostridiales bacterium]|jgi:spore coat protein JB|nr:spore coat protein CotJB [Clostridiales bacterium]